MANIYPDMVPCVTVYNAYSNPDWNHFKYFIIRVQENGTSIGEAKYFVQVDGRNFKEENPITYPVLKSRGHPRRIPENDVRAVPQQASILINRNIGTTPQSHIPVLGWRSRGILWVGVEDRVSEGLHAAGPLFITPSNTDMKIYKISVSLADENRNELPNNPNLVLEHDGYISCQPKQASLSLVDNAKWICYIRLGGAAGLPLMNLDPGVAIVSSDEPNVVDEDPDDYDTEAVMRDLKIYVEENWHLFNAPDLSTPPEGTGTPMEPAFQDSVPFQTTGELPGSANYPTVPSQNPATNPSSTTHPPAPM
jgi:hypothetical protein